MASFEDPKSFDCPRDLAQMWMETALFSRTHPPKTLAHHEIAAINKVRRMSESEMKISFEQFMHRSFKYFLSVDNQITSFQRFWRSIMAQKIRYSEAPHKGLKYKSKLELRQHLLGINIIPQRVENGLVNVASDAEMEKDREGREPAKWRGTGLDEFGREVQSRLWGQATQKKELKKLKKTTVEDSDSSSAESSVPNKGIRRGGRNEPKRGRKTNKSTRTGKSFRHTSKESGAYRQRRTAKESESESESATMDDSTSSSEDPMELRNGKRLQVQPDNDYLRRKKEIRKIIETEIMTHPIDDPDWGRRLPKLFKNSYFQLQSKDQDTTNPLDSSDSEESTSSSTRRGRKNTKASTRQRKIQTRKQDSASSSEESVAGQSAAEKSAAEESAAEGSAAEESAAEGSTLSKKRKPIGNWLARNSTKRRVRKSAKDSSSGEESESATIKDSTSDESVTEQGVAPRQGSEEL